MILLSLLRSGNACCCIVASLFALVSLTFFGFTGQQFLINTLVVRAQSASSYPPVVAAQWSGYSKQERLYATFPDGMSGLQQL